MLSFTKSRTAGKSLIQTLFFLLLVSQICFAQGFWIQAGYMPDNRYAHTVDEINGKIYVVGGGDHEGGSFPAIALVCDTSSGIWDTIPLYNNVLRNCHNSCVVNSKLYVMGGNNGIKTVSTMEVLDPFTTQWTSLDSMPTDRGLAACAVVNETFYVIGGIRGYLNALDYTGLDTVEAYDINTGQWTSKAEMPTKRWGHSAVAYNGKIYVFGGRSTGVPYSSIEVYDPEFNTWETISDSTIPTPRYCLTTCVLDTYIYAIGGWYHSGGGPIYDKVEVYNPESNTWYTETPMPTPLAVLAGIVLDGKIYLYGGSCTTHPCTGTSSIYEFTPLIVPVEVEVSTPLEFLLEQNYPNPFNPVTVIKYSIPEVSNVTLKLYNLLGEEVATLVNEEKVAGYHKLEFNAINLPSGVYFYQLRAGKYIETKKMLLLK